jgi:hypothetical protein
MMIVALNQVGTMEPCSTPHRQGRDKRGLSQLYHEALIDDPGTQGARARRWRQPHPKGRDIILK